MRVVIIGATGNHGTAVLKALQSTHEVTHITGIARRLPDANFKPYAGCEWETVDIAAASTATDAIIELTDILQGTDAVIHLAWLIQPNKRRELLSRVNVKGTRRVAEAIAAAGVPRLVVASSVGAHAPDHSRKDKENPPLREENWPATGIASTHYSCDKAGTVAANAGCIDMAMQAPMMDSSGAVKGLGWQPQHSVADALRELFNALCSGQRASFLPLRPRERVPVAPSGDIPNEMSQEEPLQLQLTNHLTGATAATDRVAHDYVDTPMFATVSALAVEIQTKRESLKNFIQRSTLKQMSYRQAVADDAEKIGRLKDNERVASRPP
ncbi:hypothetical protein N24_2406 [Corynebacterium suranareeae]|uniref:NAD-dependent epimerase/dehydratase domain-containing protein n=1 Tax=Corynebacterium suranareeae TaxID=2506452 RepID=A0A161JP08_9CORY|nr:NAD-dependent epimerase/dehydratase family protein [Corynebacterium suranareeae]BAU96668.1 hypothetical protein N24_2406 [Corynebacterium suranareeae]